MTSNFYVEKISDAIELKKVRYIKYLETELTYYKRKTWNLYNLFSYKYACKSRKFTDPSGFTIDAGF